MQKQKNNGQHGTNRAAVVAVAAISALLGFAAVYGTLGRHDNAEQGGAKTEAANAAPSPAPSAEPAKGGLTGFVMRKEPENLADVTFVDGNGKDKKLSDFKGKIVLLNLWATWCAPCREEMPSLDRLQKALGSDKFEVVALAVDRGGLDAARKFLAGINVTNLALYADSTSRSGPALKAVGMPTTILIGKDGRELGRLPGPAAWDSAEAKSLIESAMR